MKMIPLLFFLHISLIGQFHHLEKISKEGKVIDSVSFYSDNLHMNRTYAVYLPPGYENTKKIFPVLYLLHGSGDNQKAWIDLGNMAHITDSMIAIEACIPMIIVMPDANTKRMGYYNRIDTSWNYEDFFFEELMVEIDKRYRTAQGKQHTAIAGLSMGGSGTYMYALHHPEKFSIACPLSANTGYPSLQVLKEDLKHKKVDKADSSIENYYIEHTAKELIAKWPDSLTQSVKWYIDCGDDDFLLSANMDIINLMKKRKIPFQFRVRDGEHNWAYWRSALPGALQYISKEFKP